MIVHVRFTPVDFSPVSAFSLSVLHTSHQFIFIQHPCTSSLPSVILTILEYVLMISSVVFTYYFLVNNPFPVLHVLKEPMTFREFSSTLSKN